MARKKQQKDKEFNSDVLDIDRVERMTAGGRRLRFRALVAVGNRKGKVGVGLAKGNDVGKAIEKATRKAKKEMIEVNLTEEGTIAHEVIGKHGAAKVLLKPQSKGRGLVAGGAVRSICSMAGVQDISSKILGNTRNKLNNAKATIEALNKIKE